MTWADIEAARRARPDACPVCHQPRAPRADGQPGRRAQTCGGAECRLEVRRAYRRAYYATAVPPDADAAEAQRERRRLRARRALTRAVTRRAIAAAAMREAVRLAEVAGDSVRECGCGRVALWGDMTAAGVQEVPGGPSLELRTCACGSTLAREVTP